MESRILGALSKLDEFLLNPQVRTCSVAAHGTSRNSNSENRELMGIAPQTIPIPKWGIFLTTLVNSIAQRQRPSRIRWPKLTITWWQKTTLTWWQEVQKRFVTILTHWQQLKKRFPTAPLLLRQANRRKRAPRVNLISAVRIPLRQLKQIRLSWPFSNLRRTPIQSISTILLAESQNCLNLLQRRCPGLTENQRNSVCLKRSFPNEFANPQSVDGRRQKKLLPLSHAWWCSTNFQKHH